MPPDETPAPKAAEPGRKRYRSLLKRLTLIVAALILSLCLLVGIALGPAFPAVARSAGLKAAASHGIVGDFQVTGSLFKGFSITEVELTASESPLVSLTLKTVEVEYDLPALITAASELNWLTLLRIEDLEIELDVPATSPEKEGQSSSAAPFAAETYSPLWSLLEAEVDISNVTVVANLGEETYELASLRLALPPGSEGSLSIDSIRLPGREPIEKLSTIIVREDHGLLLERFTGRELESLQFLRLFEPSPGIWEIEGGLEVGGAAVSVAAATRGTASLILSDQQTLDLSDLPLPVEGPALKGTLSDLNLSFAGDFENPSTWEIDGEIIGSGLGIDATTLDSVALFLNDDQVTLDLRAPGLKLSARAGAPLHQFDTTKDLAQVPIDLSGSLVLESAEALMNQWKLDVPLTGELEARIENVQLIGGKSLRSGLVTLHSETLAFDGHLFPLLDLTARVTEPDRIRIDTEIFPDGSGKTFLKGGGDFLVSSLTYEGALVGEIHPVGTLGKLLEEMGLTATGDLRWAGSGSLSPQTHRGEAEVDLTDLVIRGGTPLEVSLSASYENEGISIPQLSIATEDLALSGHAEWKNQRVTVHELVASLAGERALTLTGSLPLDPASNDRFLEQPGDVLLDLTLSDLAVENVLALFSEKPPLAGRLNGSFSQKGSWDSLEAAGKFSFRPSWEETRGEPALDLELSLGGSASRPESWNAALDAVLSGLKYDEIQLGDITLAARTQTDAGGKFLTAILDAKQAGATIEAGARLDLSNTTAIDDLKDRPLDVEALVEAPDLTELWQQLAPPRWRNIPVAGALSLQLDEAEFQGTNVLGGSLEVFSDSLSIDGETLQLVDIDAEVTGRNELRASFNLTADERSRIVGGGEFDLDDQHYDGRIDLAVNLKSEGVLKNLLGRREIARLLPGEVSLAAEAAGALPDKTTSGRFELSGGDLLLAEGASPITEFAASGRFSEASLDLGLEMQSEPLDLSGKVLWDGAIARVETLEASSSGQRLFSANGAIPLSPQTMTAETWFAQEDPIEFSLVSDPISIRPLLQLFNGDSPVDGTIDLDLNVTGSPSRPAVDLDLAVAGIRLAEQNDLDVGSLRLTLDTVDETASLSGEYRHPDVNPLALDARLPFFPKDWAVGDRDFTTEKLRLSARMDRSSLSFLTTQVPAIKSIEGSIELDAEVAGTIAAPTLSGEGALGISRMRFQDRNAPSIYDVDLQTRFLENRVIIDQLKAIVAGGEVAANGMIRFEPEQEPRLDLQLGAREALVFRTPDLSIRTDAALSLSGPFSAATLSGEIGLNNCRFFKNFDLLPQTIPMRNTSVLPTVERTPRGGGAAYRDLKVGVDVEPFNNWNADLRIFTKTPFQVRSNLVESDLVADLRVTGKLAAPLPNGFLAIDEGELSLPFSSVDVEVGRIEFDEQTGFNGALNLKAKAKADDYRINIYLYNQILDPKFVLTSVPPMPSEDLMTLLVTGTTRDELIGGDTGSLAASKAATLLFKNMRKASAKADAEPTLLDDLQERTELEIGGINPETGAQTIGGKVRLWKQLFFVGDVDAENDYRALLKYVFRFR